MNVQQVVYHYCWLRRYCKGREGSHSSNMGGTDHNLMSAKRRTNPALYCFDCVFTTANNLPTFRYNELGFLPALESKVLWQSPSEEQWKSA